jgi:hypothetical protein
LRRVDAFRRFAMDLRASGLENDRQAIPRLVPIETIPNGPRIFYLVDLDGTLIRCIEDIQNERIAT